MAKFTAIESGVRLLGLGNEILADDALGILAAREVERRFGDVIQVAESCEAGFNVLDQLLGVSRLLIVDTIVTGKAKPGTIHIFEEDSVQHPLPGQSLHFIGLFEVLAAARRLGLAAPDRVGIIAVEAADCSTVGGEMHRDVRAAIPKIAEYAWRFCNE